MSAQQNDEPVVVWTWRAKLPADSRKTPGWREVTQKMDREGARRFAESQGIDFDKDMYAVPGSEEIRRPF
jgi:hypothetical protein